VLLASNASKLSTLAAGEDKLTFGDVNSEQKSLMANWGMGNSWWHGKKLVQERYPDEGRVRWMDGWL
jgi:hypothetical protein